MSGEKEVVGLSAAEQQAELDQMSAGYSDEIQEPTETPEPVAKVEPEQVSVQTPEYVQLTKGDYENLMRSANEIVDLKAAQQKMTDTAFGRIGRALEDMKTTGAPAAVTIDDFPELSTEFPEMAEMQVKGLNKALGKLRGGPAIDPVAIERLVSERTAGIRQELIESHLDGVMTDWMAEVKKPEFSEWLGKQDTATKALSESNRMSDAAKMLRLYSGRPKPNPAPKVTPLEKTQTSTRQRRLEAAVTPRGSGGNAGTSGNTDLDDMNAGYNG